MDGFAFRMDYPTIESKAKLLKNSDTRRDNFKFALEFERLKLIEIRLLKKLIRLFSPIF